MSVTATNAYTTATGNGSVKAFPFTFFAPDPSQVAVTINGVLQVAGFTTVTNPSAGGTVTFAAAPANGAAIVIRLNASFIQSVAFANAGAFNASAVDAALDQAAARSIYLLDQVVTTESKLAAEIVARVAGEAALTANLAAETIARANADTTLQNNIDAEATTRSAAVASLLGSVSALTLRDTSQDVAIASLQAVLSAGYGTAVADGVVYVDAHGAIGNGVADDGPALAAASAVLNAQGGGVLAFRPGAIYAVGGQALSLGRQAAGYSFPPNVLYPIEFSGCTKPVILRGNGATIRCLAGAKFGTFNDDGTSKGTVDPYTGGGLATPYQAMVYAHDCTAPVHLENVVLDGNKTNLTIGGQYGDVGRQIPATGLFTANNTSIVSILNVVSHHHALDGAQINGIASSDITFGRQQGIVAGLITYCNARNNLSFVGGKGWTFRGCSFNWGGKDTPNNDTISSLVSPPGAGVDLEAEGGKVIRDIVFEDCEFIGNYGPGIVSDGTNVDRVKVRRSTIIGTTEYSLWPKTPRFVFEDCTIMGCMVAVYGNADPRLAARFKRCHLLWDPAQSPTGNLYASGGNPVAVAKHHDGGSSGLNIYAEDCILENADPANGIAQTAQFWWHNCTFKANVNGYTQAYGSFSGKNTTFLNRNGTIPRQDIASATGITYGGQSYDYFTYDGVVYEADSDPATGKHLYYGSAVYDPPSLAAGAKTAIQTIATAGVYGVALGDRVEDVSFSQDLAGARIMAWVSAAHTVSYYFINENGANPLDLASGTVLVKVRQA